MIPAAMDARRLALLVVASALCAAAGCSRAAPAPSRTVRTDVVAKDGKFELEMRLDDRAIHVAVDPGVPARYRTGDLLMRTAVAATDFPDDDLLLVRGERVVVGERLDVGGRDAGPLPDGAKVGFDAEGVLIDGERRLRWDP